MEAVKWIGNIRPPTFAVLGFHSTWPLSGNWRYLYLSPEGERGEGLQRTVALELGTGKTGVLSTINYDSLW